MDGFEIAILQHGLQGNMKIVIGSPYICKKDQSNAKIQCSGTIIVTPIQSYDTFTGPSIVYHFEQIKVILNKYSIL